MKATTAARETTKRLANKGRNLGIALVLMSSLGLGFVGGLLGRNANLQGSASQNTGISKEHQQVVLSESQLISEIAKKVGPSVVSVNTTAQSQQMNFFGFSTPSQQEGAGTGVIISEDGYIITNRHVVPEGTTDVSVTMSDGTTLSDVKVVGRTSANDPLDIAFLKVGDKKDKKLTPAAIGDSSKVAVGEKVVAIGNALGQFQNTVTTGVISGFGRSVQAGDSSGAGATETLQNLFQTDAAINEGNSGGPLVNANGEVIGINTAVAGGTAQNIGFAIPINDAKGSIESVLSSGKLERPYLGVRYVTLTDDYAYYYNLPVKRGAYVAPSNAGSSIITDSPADKAGIETKDIITKINNESIDESHSLTSLVGKYKVGETVKVTVLRDGKEQVLDVKLDAAPNQ